MLKKIEAQLESTQVYSVELKLAKAKIMAKKKRFDRMVEDMSYLVSVGKPKILLSVNIHLIVIL